MASRVAMENHNAISAPVSPQVNPVRSRAVVALVALGLATLVGALIMAIWIQHQNASDTDWVEHTLQVEARVNELAALNEQVETGRRGYLLRGIPIFQQHVREALAPMPALIDQLDRLTGDNVSQQQRIDELRQLTRERIRLLGQTQTMVDAGRRVTARAQFGNDRLTQITRRIRRIADQMAAEEQGLLKDRNARQRATLNLLYTVLAITGFLVIIISASVLIILSRAARALERTNTQLSRLNDDLEGAVTERTAELQRANQEIQRFAYIVSHDLRSPLVNVMGFTSELEASRKVIAAYLDTLFEAEPERAEEAVRLAIDEDLPESLDFIRTSTAKMDRLINAILQLSRQGQRRLAPEPVDLTALAQGIADSLHHLAQDAGAEVTIAPLPEIVTDRLAIEQILSNLIENALKYLKPGRPGDIRVSGHRRHGRVIIEIADNGRGIDPHDHERIFELFRRAGQQDKPGEGLGLAYVRAMTYRLGGIIEVKSVLDQGTTFRLSLPATISAAQ